MGILDGVYLTHKEKIERNIPLPDILNIYEIAQLWSNDKREQNIYMEAIYKAFGRGDLKGMQREKDNDEMVIISPYMLYYDVEINKDDFKAWLDSENELLKTNCLLSGWVNIELKLSENDVENLSLVVQSIETTSNNNSQKSIDADTLTNDIAPKLKEKYPFASTSDLIKHANELVEYVNLYRGKNGFITDCLEKAGIPRGKRGQGAKPLVAVIATSK